jgi:ribonuclease P protein component
VNVWFAVYARKNEYTFSRIGIAASKKVMPNAVSRNLSKRLIRETFRLEFPVGAAMDVVVYPKRRISQKNLAESRNALRQLLAAAQ